MPLPTLLAEDAMTAKKKPVCDTCNDTHIMNDKGWMWRRDVQFPAKNAGKVATEHSASILHVAANATILIRIVSCGGMTAP